MRISNTILGSMILIMLLGCTSEEAKCTNACVSERIESGCKMDETEAEIKESCASICELEISGGIHGKSAAASLRDLNKHACLFYKGLGR